MVDQIVQICGTAVYVLPDELTRIRGGPSIAAAPTDEHLAVVSRRLGHFARRIFCFERLRRDDGRFAVDGRERVHVPGRRNVNFILLNPFFISPTIYNAFHPHSSKTHRQRIRPLLLLIANFLVGRKPHELCTLAAILGVFFFERADDAHPRLIRPFGF